MEAARGGEDEQLGGGKKMEARFGPGEVLLAWAWASFDAAD